MRSSMLHVRNVPVRPGVSRIRLERLEDRTQPGSLLPFSEFSMMGHDLFERDPLTGRLEDLVSSTGLVSQSSGIVDAGSPFGLGETQQTRLVQPAAGQPTEATAISQVETRQLLQAAAAAATTPKTTAAVSTPSEAVRYELQPGVMRLSSQGVPVQPLTGLEVKASETAGNPRDVGTILYTTLNGALGADWGHAVAVDDDGNAYYAGYTERNGNRDMLVWKISLESFGTYRDWEVVIGSEGGGADEARGIAVSGSGESAVVMVTGYVAGTGGSDLSIMRLDPLTGGVTQAATVAGPGNDRGNDIDLFIGGFVACVTGDLSTASGATEVYAGCVLPDDLELALYSNGYTAGAGITQHVGDALAMSFGLDTISVGWFVDGATTRPYFMKIDLFGNLVYSSAVAQPGMKFGGVDLLEDGLTTEFVINGEVPNTAGFMRMPLGKFQDNGATFTQLWGGSFFLIASSVFPADFHVAGNYLRLGSGGEIYTITEIWGPAEGRDTGDNDAQLIKVASTGDRVTDYFHYGLTGAAALGNDKGFGLATWFGTPLVYVTGKVSSPDNFKGCSGGACPAFPTSEYAYQPTRADSDGITPDAFSSFVIVAA
jgi:hypothetical protein